MNDPNSDNLVIPHLILVDPEFFGPPQERGQDLGPTLAGRVAAILRDSTGDQYAIFELPETFGLHAIHLGSRFFRGWAAQ